MEQESNQSVVIAVIITFVIAFWIGFFVGWLITGRSVEPSLPAFENKDDYGSFDTSATRDEEPAGESISGTAGTLRADNQLAGRSAQVASVSLTREGWVVIHEDAEGGPGAILGAAWLLAGSHEHIAVDLLRGMEAGRRYHAMLHNEVDGSESHLFDLAKDLPMQDAAGKVIMVSFETIASPN